MQSQSPNPNTQQLQLLQQQQQPATQQQQQNQGNTVGKINDTPNLSTVGKFYLLFGVLFIDA